MLDSVGWMENNWKEKRVIGDGWEGSEATGALTLSPYSRQAAPTTDSMDRRTEGNAKMENDHWNTGKENGAWVKWG